mgnify:CR=1 FL=1
MNIFDSIEAWAAFVRPSALKSFSGGRAEMLKRFNLMISLSLGLLLSGGLSELRADPVVALSNLPNPGNLTLGGSYVSSSFWKALLFKTPESVGAEMVSLTISLNCYGSPGCPYPGAYPVTVKIQIDLYSVNAGIPDAQIQSLPMQEVTLNSTAQTLTFAIPHWPLRWNTTYAVVLKSEDAQKFKWANVKVNGTGDDILPTAENGFSYSGVNSYTADAGLSWTSSGASSNNAVTLYVQLVPTGPSSPAPTVSQWMQVLLALLIMMLVGWQYRQQRPD